MHGMKASLPSLVTVTSPMSSTSILSRPTGPRDVLTMLAMAVAAITVLVWEGKPGKGKGKTG